MIIYKDVITGKELFTDSHKMKYDEELNAYVVHTKMENVSTDVEVNIGANPSAEEEEEQYEQGQVERKLGIVANHRYNCCEDFKVKSYGDYAKSLQAHYKENQPDKLDEMKKAFNNFLQSMVKKKKVDSCSIDLFREVDENFDGYMPIFVWEGGEDGSFYYFKYAIEEEKC